MLKCVDNHYSTDLILDREQKKGTNRKVGDDIRKYTILRPNFGGIPLCVRSLL